MTKKKEKITQSKFDGIMLSKNERWEDLISLETISQNPGKDEWRARLIRTMLIEAANEDILEIMEFCLKYKIAEITLWRWSKKYDDIGRAYEFMKKIIASRRRIGCMRKRLDSYSSLRDIHLLDSQDDEVNRYHMEMKRLKDVEEQVRYLLEIVKPKVLAPAEMIQLPNVEEQDVRMGEEERA